MDVLTDWLREIETSAVVLCRSQVFAPWGLDISARDGVMFHMVTDGACWLRRPGASPMHLLQGDLVLLPQGLDHQLGDTPHPGKVESLDDFLKKPSVQITSNPMTTLVCGVYLCDIQMAHPMLSALPPVVHFSAASVRSKPALAATLALLTIELESKGPGSEAIIQHLFDVLYVYIVRAWAEETVADRPGWLSVLKDPALSRAMTRMHSDPAKKWTVESLADQAGLSRPVFARRFAEQVGEPPLTYLTRWRMIVAARLLQSSMASLSEVSAQVGYESEFSFSRAFKQARGVSPALFRRTECSKAALSAPRRVQN